MEIKRKPGQKYLYRTDFKTDCNMRQRKMDKGINPTRRDNNCKYTCIQHCCCLLAKSCLTLCDPRLLCRWDFPGKNTRVGCHFLLQGIKPTSPTLAGRLLTSEPSGKPPKYIKEILTDIKGEIYGNTIPGNFLTPH